MGISVDQWRRSIGGNAIPNLLCLGPSLTRLNKRPVAYFFLLLLVIGGDIHPHPGPYNNNSWTWNSNREKLLFNGIRSIDNKIAARKSHVEFYGRCLNEKVIPNGLDFKVAFTAAFPESRPNMEKFVESSKFGLLKALKESYEGQIPPLMAKKRDLLSSLSETCNDSRFLKLSQDLESFVRKNALRLKYNKNRKISAILHQKQLREQPQQQLQQQQLRRTPPQQLQHRQPPQQQKQQQQHQSQQTVQPQQQQRQQQQHQPQQTADPKQQQGQQQEHQPQQAADPQQQQGQQQQHQPQQTAQHRLRHGNWIPDLSLYDKDLEVIERGSWIPDEIMDAASFLLRREFAHVSGLESASLSRLGFWYNPYEGIQFHNQNETHWILSSSLNGKIQIFDSLKGITVTPNLQRQVTQLYSPDGNSITLEVVDVQQQYGGSDCGLFAIAFAIDLLMGNDVSSIQYDQAKFRTHLRSCIDNRRITPFPRKRCRAERGPTHIVDGDWKSPSSPVKRRSKEELSCPISLSNSFESLQEAEVEEKKMGQEKEQEEFEETEGIRNRQKNNWKPGQLVLNLSDYRLNEEEKKVLELGLKYSPTPLTINAFKLMKDLLAFNRRLRLREYFHGISSQPKPKWMKQASKRGFEPPPNREPSMEAYIEQVNQDILNLLKSNIEKHHPNMTQSERKALESLKENKNIIIKPADKGGAIVVMHKMEYDKEILKMLGDDQFYKESSKDLNKSFSEDLETIIQEMKDQNLINEKEAQFLFQKECITPILYGLPKVHKMFDQMPSFRPIVSGCGSCMEGVSKFVDFYLKPLAANSASYIKDTTDFLRKIKDLNISETDILVAADVCSLYTVINHDEGLEACKGALGKRSQTDKKKMPTKILTTLILKILKSNCFSFLGRFFLQICGTAMGTPMAPSYANIFMTAVETKILLEYEKQTGLKPMIWYRFLDDIIFIWPHGEQSLKEFLDYMQEFGEKNFFKTSLKFTFEYGRKVPFLDTTVSLEDGQVVTDLFCKKTDAHLYLRNDSCHPKNCLKGLAKGEFLRVKRICSSEENFKKRASELKGFFIKRGFQETELNKALEEVTNQNREDLLNYKEKKRNDRVPFVLTYHPRLKRTSHILHKHFPLLNANKRLTEVFPEAPMAAFRRLPNIRDQLVKSGKEPTSLEQNQKCGDGRCKCCHLFNQEKEIKVNGHSFTPRDCGTCKSSNLIYTIQCKRCNLSYVGETKQALSLRISGHRTTINRVKRGGKLDDDSNDNGTAYHFSEGSHNFETDAEVAILENGSWRSCHERRSKEDFFILKFGTLQPGGINVKKGSFSTTFQGKI
jgi:hypothetical protein